MSTPEWDSEDPNAQLEVGALRPDSDDLLRSTPLRLREWLLAPMVLALAGGAAIAVLIGMALPYGLTFSGWGILSVAGLVIVYAVLFAWSGYRAYARDTPATSASFLSLKVAGFSALVTVAILAGVIGASFLVVMIGLGSAVALFGK
ncbi:hypothetical protein [Cryobacterium sp. GrIS_2_6]|uniref:hypothetical protein n=1 Tax=Cryobacterium sp. GrIS_2_6 TaxID=3162785 RepID=UPI002E02B1D9|nr:hypothetical protein [Cryobacterium psychrotolerans]